MNDPTRAGRSTMKARGTVCFTGRSADLRIGAFQVWTEPGRNAVRRSAGRPGCAREPGPCQKDLSIKLLVCSSPAGRIQLETVQGWPMKIVMLLALLLLAGRTGFGQGYVNFNTLASPGTAVVTDQTGFGPPFSGVAGANYKAMLYAGPAGTTNFTLLTTYGVGGTPATFLTGAQAGYFNGGVRHHGV